MTRPTLHCTAMLLLLSWMVGYSGLATALELRSGSKRNTLVELYTSQGCSSCPPAERWLGGLKEDARLWRRIIPVAFHVDYWDYLGWKDRLALPANAARQRLYQRQGGLSAVYTPGLVVNGKEWRRWFGLRELPVSDDAAGVLSLQLDGDLITASYTPQANSSGALQLHVAILGVGIEATIARGENAGKLLPQDFSLLAHSQLRSEEGRWQLPLPPYERHGATRLAIAAWVSRGERLVPLQAVGGWMERQE